MRGESVMVSLRAAATAVGLSWSFFAGPASAQIDYRNLDDERPVATEDAYPVERYAFELLASYRFERERGGERVHLFPLELAYGVFDNTQVGLKVPLAGLDAGPGADTDWGLAGLDAFALYNFNTESPTLPAFSLRADASVPVGSLAGDAARLSLKAIATRSWGRSRVHLNAVRSIGTEDDLGTVEVAPRWSYSVAADRTLFRQSILLVGEVVAARAVRGAPVEVNAAVGARYQWSPTLVLDVGVARRLRDEIGPDYAFTVGLSHAFGLEWLMPGRVRRAPRSR
jgi:hypothetical protein